MLGPSGPPLCTQVLICLALSFDVIFLFNFLQVTPYTNLNENDNFYPSKMVAYMTKS